jgi:hypothetical protein
MAYTLLTAFIDMKLTDNDPPEKWAKVYAEKWSQLDADELETALLPLFRKLKIAGEELKRIDKSHLLSDKGTQ